MSDENKIGGNAVDLLYVLNQCADALAYVAFNYDGRTLESLDPHVLESTGVSETALIAERSAREAIVLIAQARADAPAPTAQASGDELTSEQTLNVLESCARFLGSRTKTVWAMQFGYTDLMKHYASDLLKIRAAALASQSAQVLPRAAILPPFPKPWPQRRDDYPAYEQPHTDALVEKELADWRAWGERVAGQMRRPARAAPAAQRLAPLTEKRALEIAAEQDYGDEDPKCILRLVRAIERELSAGGAALDSIAHP